MSPRISIIVPCYNSARTIERTIHSVLMQNCVDWELILVDDGSSDDTAQRIRSIPDRRIHLIQQENRGPSAARNNGINHASGDWICFLDSDDMLLPRALDTLLAATNATSDIIIGCFQFHDHPVSSISHTTPVHLGSERLAANTLFWQKYEEGIKLDVFRGERVQHELNLGAPWAKLYRRAFINEHKLRFHEKLVLHEDTLFNHLAYIHASSVSIVPTPVYCYLDNPDSLTRSQNARYIEHSTEALAQFLLLHPDYPEELCYFAMYRILECWQGICSATPYTPIVRYRLVQQFRKHPIIAKCSKLISLTNNPYFNMFEKWELFLIKNHLLFTLVFIMPLIRAFRSLKNAHSKAFRTH